MIRDHIYTARGPLSAWTVYISWMTPIISFISSILIPLCFGSIEIAGVPSLKSTLIPIKRTIHKKSLISADSLPNKLNFKF